MTHAQQQCYWETFQSGCQKKSCSFYHKFPRNIEGLFLPPTNEAGSTENSNIGPKMAGPTKTRIIEAGSTKNSNTDIQIENGTIHHLPLTVIIRLMDDEDDEADGSRELNDKSRVKTHEEEEEEKAILAVCRSAGDIFKISVCEDKKEPEEEFPEGNYRKDGKRWRKKFWYTDHEPRNNEEKGDYGGENPRPAPPDIGDKEKSAPSNEKGHGSQKPAENSETPVQENDGEADKKTSKPNDPPSGHDRSPNCKGPQHYYRGDYRKDGQRWRKKYWSSDHESENNAEKEDYDYYEPYRKPYRRRWRKPNKNDENHREDKKLSDQEQGEKPPSSNDHQQADRRHQGNYKKHGQRWRKKYWLTDHEPQNSAEKGDDGGENPRPAPPDIGDKEKSGPSNEKGRPDFTGHDSQKPAENSATPVQTNDGEADKKTSKPNDPPSGHDRSPNCKGPQHYYRGDYRKDGRRWRKKYWYTDHEPQNNAEKEDYDNNHAPRKPSGQGRRKANKSY
ncbi:uncharacterized protein C12orf50 homolog isoform X3 [Hyla sarda]|uniref:uncharacterized protein C12orf50 homolog isoform X3 n=1 Tax=Hyla sarda TaxID=327740 RepID=UPI0024C2FB7B|nr:uncharacterized protein C12orf50 homolog isoform X3 [Hyla sarda]